MPVSFPAGHLDYSASMGSHSLLSHPAVRTTLLVLVAAAGVAVLWSVDDREASAMAEPPALAQSSAVSIPSEASPEAPSTLAQRVAAVDVAAELPPSLEGTWVPDGWNRVDASGALIPTLALRQMFEYFLSALGEESLEQLIARIRATLSVLEEPARGQALAILGAYLDYKLAVAELEHSWAGASAADVDTLQQRMNEIQALRRTWLDADTAAAFFAREEAIDRFQMERRRIQADPGLTPEQRAAALRQAEARLPEPVRLAREETRQFSRYQQMRETLADDPEALAQWRVQTFGPEAAERLAQVEADQRAWQTRWQAYQKERDALLQAGLAGPELEAALHRLRTTHFSGHDLLRAEALDSIR